MLSDLQKCHDLKSFASLVNYRPSSIAYLVHVVPDSDKYTAKTILKKNGGDRVIYAPSRKLKALQRTLSDLLYNVLDELPETEKARYAPSYGYRRGRSIVDNSSFHKKSKFVFNVDIDRFFDSIHIGRIIGFFCNDNRFKLHPDVAKLIGQIACREGRLPQGSPCSPIISDLIGGIIDAKLSRLARTHNCRYSRYVDDITFSTRDKVFPTGIARDFHDEQGWMAGPALLKQISDLGFKLNASKTRMSVCTGRQLVTGLVANAKPNLTKEGRLRLRAMCDTMFKGKDPFKDAFWTAEKESQEVANRSFLRGRLAFQYHVDHHFDARDPAQRRREESLRDRLFRRFLMFDIFFPEAAPRLITEGDTDKLYLKAAFFSLRPNDPRFIKKIPNEPDRFVPRFLNRTNSVQKILGFHNGTPGISSALNDYNAFRHRYPLSAQRFPVVVVVDNDKGLDDLKGILKKGFGVNLGGPPTTGGFYKIHKGLYLVKTPLVGKQAESTIEDLLDSTTKSVVISGKTFAPKDIDDAKNFGKSVLADHVWKNRTGTNFSGFAPLLDAIDAAFADYGY